MYVVYDGQGKFIDCKVLSNEGKRVMNEHRPLVACKTHSDEQIEAAVSKVYGKLAEEEDD
jgi:hypothetical protein